MRPARVLLSTRSQRSGFRICSSVQPVEGHLALVVAVAVTLVAMLLEDGRDDGVVFGDRGIRGVDTGTIVATRAPAREMAMLRVLNFNNTSECPSHASGNGAHFAGFRRVSHGTFVGQRSKVRRQLARSAIIRRESFIKAPAVIHRGTSVMPGKLFLCAASAVVIAVIHAAAQAADAKTPAEMQKARHEHYEELGDAFKAVRDQSKASSPDFAALLKAAEIVDPGIDQSAAVVPEGHRARKPARLAHCRRSGASPTNSPRRRRCSPIARRSCWPRRRPKISMP